MSGKAITVTTTPATILRHSVELAEHRDGEDRWEMQARTLDELGYRIAGKGEPAQVGEVARLRDALALIGDHGCTRSTNGRCWDSYTRAAKYQADAWCDACVAAAALEGRDSDEGWQPGDVVLDVDGRLWTRAGETSVCDGWPWSSGSTGSTSQPPEGGVAEYGPHSPARPLTLLVRGGRSAAGAAELRQAASWISALPEGDAPEATKTVIADVLSDRADELDPQGGAR